MKILKKDRDITLQKLLVTVNNNRNSEAENLKNVIASYKRDIENYQESVERYTIALKAKEQQLKAIKVGYWDIDQLVESFKQLEKHKKVAWAFITPNLELIVQTELLHQFDPFAKKQKKDPEPVGRYAFKIQLGSYTNMTIASLDFVSQGFRHPNLMSHPGDACWGGLNSSILEMFKTGEFYNAIDAMIMFFSTMPQQGGHDPIYWYVWLNERVASFQQNPWIEKGKLFSIGKPLKAEALTFKIKKRKTALVHGVKKELAGLNFRSF